MTALRQDPLEQATERAQWYWVSDGIPLIVMGGFWILWGGVLLLPILFPGGLTRVMGIIVILAMLAMALSMKRLIHAWKERVTVPRTGYIELRQPSKAIRLIVPILAAVITFSIALLLRFEYRSFREWIPLGFGLVLAAGMLHASWKMRSLRLAALSTMVAAVAAVSFTLRLAEILSFSLTMLGAGTGLVADGLLRLQSYLHAHPNDAGDEQ